MGRKTDPLDRYMLDDLVLTISDNDEDVPNFDADVEDDLSALRKQAIKRKRDDDDSGKKKKTKKSKKEQMLEVKPLDSSVPEEEAGVDDGAFDPSFEFNDTGGLEGTVEETDGWSLYKKPEQKRGVDIDEIVAKRRAKELSEKQLAAESEGSSDLSDDEPDVDGENGFDGLQWGGEEDSEGSISGGDENMDFPADEEEEISDEAGNGDNVSAGQTPDDSGEDDDGSIAEPVPHPDDLSDDEVEADDVKARRNAFFAPEESVKQASSKEISFLDMNLSRPILKGLTALHFYKPTPIQAKTIPFALMGKDIVGGAVTGSGKTAAFVVPILERLLYRAKKVPTTRVGILMPTRELAAQCFDVASKLASFTDITFALLVGGLSSREQEQTLKKRPDVVIATPGRFIDHMRNSASFTVETLEILVMDEADRMLEDGFADEINEILNTIPKSRQTMLFSATMTQDVDQLIRAGLNRPIRLMVDEKKKTVSGLLQEFIKMKGGKGEIDEVRRLAYLLHLCVNTYTTKTIVFLPRKELAHRVKVLFSLHGIRAAELHGDISQEQRLHAMARFQSGECTHLLATDLASRGLDIARVETVLNFTVPTTTTTYLHRVGRTARAGQSGVSCTLFSGSKAGSSKSKDKSSGTTERTFLRPILKLARSQNAALRTRTLPPLVIDELTDKIHSLDDEIESILKEEKQERMLQVAERDVAKGENLVKYQDEIASRPRRTWFQSEKEKKAASKVGIEERTGTRPQSIRKILSKGKLSGKDRKKLLNHDERSTQGMGWKKGKAERAGKGVLQAPKKNKSKPKAKDGGVRKKVKSGPKPGGAKGNGTFKPRR